MDSKVCLGIGHISFDYKIEQLGVFDVDERIYLFFNIHNKLKTSTIVRSEVNRKSYCFFKEL